MRACVTEGISDGWAACLSWRVSDGDGLSDTEQANIYLLAVGIA